MTNRLRAQIACAADVFIDFLQRLVRSRSKKVYLIVNRHPVHVSEAVALWVEKHQDRIRLIYLPAYSPELNPGEYLNGREGQRSGPTEGQDKGPANEKPEVLPAEHPKVPRRGAAFLPC